MLILVTFFFFKQKTSYEMRISDWSSDVCSSDLELHVLHVATFQTGFRRLPDRAGARPGTRLLPAKLFRQHARHQPAIPAPVRPSGLSDPRCAGDDDGRRSEEHTSELQSLMRSSYAVFCLHKKTYTHIALCKHN